MKRLLLLLILFPVMLFGQTRRQDVVDSLKAATNLQHISEVINNNRGTRIENISSSDSDEYVTIAIRVHVPKPDIIATLSFYPITELETADIVPLSLATVTIPPLPPVIAELDTIPPLSYAGLTLIPEALPVTNSGKATSIPSLPHVLSYLIEILSPVDFIQLRIEHIVFVSKAKMVAVPLPPDVESWAIDPILSFCDAIPLPIVHSSVSKPDTVAVPTFEEKKYAVEGMHLSDEGYSLLEKLEGFSPDLYNLGDGGYTIGFGFFIPYSEGNKWEKGVTIEEAEVLMRQKVPQYEDQVKQYINVPITQREFDALTMLAYNLGGFSRATSIVNDINTQAGFDKLQADWNRFIHSKAPGVTKGLMNRRRDELKVRNESDYQLERKIQIFRFRR